MIAGPLKTYALASLAIPAGLLAAAVAGEAPRDPGHIAAVFPPWWSAQAVSQAAAAAGRIQAGGGLTNIVIVAGDPARLAGRLHDAGALVLLDPEAARGCSKPVGDHP